MPRMAERRILRYPDPRLKAKARPVGTVTDETRALADDLLETMYAAPGIGLAATQVGVPLRVAVVDCSPKEDEPQPLVLIDPKIAWSSAEKVTREEGCLSIPEQYFEVERPVKVRVEFMDRDGERVEREFDDIWATCVQHEIDHLNGILFIDRLSLVKRRMVRRKLAKEFAAKAAAK